MNKTFIVIIFLGMFVKTYAQEISVAVFYERKPQGVTLTVQKGTYLVYNDFELVDTLNTGNNISVVKESNYLVYRNRAKAWATDKNIKIVNTGDGAFFLNYTGSVEPARCYEGWMKLALNDYSILAINYVHIDDYVAAVVESQGGGMSSEEYFKARTIMIRTYTLLHHGKHSSEGFDMCDGTHCQFYKNKATNRVIIKASEKTSGMILVDKYKNLINPLSHLNSGGITSPGDYVFDEDMPYLASIEDQYAKEGSNYTWKTMIPAAEWQQYLVKKGMKSASSKLHKQILIVQKGERMKEFKIGNESISLHRIKTDWGWKSSYFTMSLDKGIITVKGYGNGHGVGLAIESAKAMAAKGMTYDKILNFFYKDIHIVGIKELNIYNQILAQNQKDKP